MAKYCLVGYYLILKINSTVTRDRVLIATGYKYNCHRVIYFIDTQDADIKKSEIPYLSRFPYQIDHISIIIVAFPLFMSKLFGCVNDIEPHKKYRQPDLVLENYTKLQCYAPHFLYLQGWYHNDRWGGILNGSGVAKQRGEQGPGGATAMEWRHPGLSLCCENPPENNTKYKMMTRFGGELRDGDAGIQRHGGTCNRQNLQGLIGNWAQAQGSKEESAPERETMSDAGTRSGAQGRVVEADGWQLRLMPRWAAFCTRTGGGERAKREGFGDKQLRMGRRQ